MSTQIIYSDRSRQAVLRGAKQLADPLENMGAQMVREVVSKTSDIGDDGTDPTQVTRTALQNAASIASLMPTAEAMTCTEVEQDSE